MNAKKIFLVIALLFSIFFIAMIVSVVHYLWSGAKGVKAQAENFYGFRDFSVLVVALDLPEQATNISFEGRPRPVARASAGGFFVFDIPESDWLDWMHTQGWEAKRRENFSDYAHSGYIFITNGYYFYNSWDAEDYYGGYRKVKVSYDIDAQKCYYENWFKRHRKLTPEDHERIRRAYELQGRPVPEKLFRRQP